MAYYCGWDGGGTKTTVLCTNEDGQILHQSSFGPLNPNGNPIDAVRQTIHDAVAFMSACRDGLAGCRMLVIGVAGASSTDTVSLIRQELLARGYTGRLRIAGDQEIALAGSIHGPGAVLISGTGSVCCGRDEQGNMYRSGGYGYLIDDCGSGYAIGHDILQAIVRAEDLRGPATSLREAVYAALNIADVRGLITWLYAPATGKKEIAALASLLLPALDSGDPVAIAIANKAGDDLTDLVSAFWKQAGLTAGQLVLSGSILTHYPAVQARLLNNLHSQCPLVRVVEPWGSAAEGAALMARMTVLEV